MSGSVSRPALLALSVLQSCSHPQHPALILTREGGTSRAGYGTQHPRGDRGRERCARAPCGVASGAGQQPDSIPATRFRLQGHRTCAGSGTEFSAQSRTFTINSDFGILLAASTHNRNTVITIDGDSEWTIGAAGSYAITFVAAGVSSTQLRFQKQSSGEASWATLSGQFYARGDDSAASNEVRGCAWCGDLSQSDKIRVHGTTEAQIFSDPPTFTISKKTLMILRT